ncbi:MAG: Maltooligosyl trehalose synthase, partial [Chlamydiae bacterium]|nr:Maltooligosyl trehalose synthase [Chlamydiota bacterium]
MKKLDVPSSIYRLQLHEGFNFKKATAILPYLKKLGIDGLYCSPYYVAYSQHGYDITNPNKINPKIGTHEEFESFCAKLKELGMKNIIDVVPNHMGIKGGMNAWWQDVLEHGPQSRYASFFDIDWDSEKRALQNKVIFPILGEPYRKCLETGEIQLKLDAGGLSFHYFDYVLPLAPKTYALVLQDKAFATVLSKVMKFPTTPVKRETLTACLKQQVHEKVLSAKGLKARVKR